MRQLWWMACGVWDLEIDARNFWRGQLGGRPWTEDERREAHPLRRLEAPTGPRPKPSGSTPEVAELLDSCCIPED